MLACALVLGNLRILSPTGWSAGYGRTVANLERFGIWKVLLREEERRKGCLVRVFHSVRGSLACWKKMVECFNASSIKLATRADQSSRVWVIAALWERFIHWSTLTNSWSHSTLVLLWPGHDCWENSHSNSRLSTLINSRVLAWPNSKNAYKHSKQIAFTIITLIISETIEKILSPVTTDPLQITHSFNPNLTPSYRHSDNSRRGKKISVNFPFIHKQRCGNETKEEKIDLG